MGRIESTDLVAPKVLEPMRVEVETSTKTLEAFSEEQVKVLKNSAKMAKQIKVNTAGFKALAAEERKSKNALSEKERADKRILSLQQKSTKVTKIQKERIAALRVEEQRRNKIITQQAKLQNQNIGAFEKLNLKIKQTSDRYRNLLVQEGKETRQTKLLKKQILELNAVRDRANKSIGIGTNMTKGFKAGVGKLTGALGKMGIAFGAFAILRDVFGVIKSFDQASADLASVLGINREEMGALTEQAKELGATTKFTASQVAELQIEFAKLGFSQQEIAGVTEATLQLAAAAGTELGNAATIVGSTLRGFNLGVDQTQRLVDLMAKSFSSSSLDIEKFSSAMSNVGPAANAVGLSIERTTALIGTLTDAGIDASSAGTGLRNMFLEAKKQGITFEEAMEQINSSTDKLGTSFDLFGKKGATLGVILAENGANVDELEAKLNNAGGAAKEMADKQLDTLGGALDLLRSAWEGFILGASEAGGVVDILKNSIRFLADNFRVIMKVLGGLIKIWIAYKLQVKLAAVGMKIYRTEVVKGIAVSKGLIPNLRKMAKGFKFASISVKGFGTALKSIPFLAIASGIFTVISLFTDLGDETEELEKETSALDEAIKEINENYSKEKVELRSVFEALKATEKGTKERQDAVDAVNAEYGTTLQNLEDEAEFVNQVDAAYKALIETMKQKVRMDATQERRLALVKELVEKEDELIRVQMKLADHAKKWGEDDIATSIDPFEARLRQEINMLNHLLGQLEGTDLDTLTPGGGGTGTGATTKDPLTDADIQRKNFADLKRINKANLTAIELDARKSGKTQEEISDELIFARIGNLQKELSFARKHFGLLSDEALKAELERDSLIEKMKFDAARREQDALDKKDAKDKQRFKDLQDTNKENISTLENNALKEGKKREDIDDILADARIENLKRENEEALKLFGEDSPEYLKANLALNKALVEQDRKAAEEKKKIQEELIESLRDALSTAAELIAQSIERNIQAIENQIKQQERIFDESKNREEELKEIARERKLDASESINFEREAQKKALKTQGDLERKRQRAEALIAALRALAAQVESGKGNPVQNIKNQINSLKSFVDGSFYKGTEYTVSNSLGHKPGRDSHNINVDGKESIFTGKQTHDLGIRPGGNSTDDIVRMYKSSFANEADKLNRVAVIQGGGNDKVLAGKMDQLIKEVKHQVDPNGLTFNAINGALNYRDRRSGQKYSYPVSKRK